MSPVAQGHEPQPPYTGYSGVIVPRFLQANALAQTGSSHGSVTVRASSGGVDARNVSARSHASEPDGLNKGAASAYGCHVCCADTVEGSHGHVRVTMNGAGFRVTRWVYRTPNVAQSEFECARVEEVLYLDTVGQLQMALA